MFLIWRRTQQNQRTGFLSLPRLLASHLFEVGPDAFSGYEYISQKEIRSVLSLPLVKQAKLIGVLYLENNLTTHVFTPARVSVLELLASQAAISLENARLYNELQARETKIRRLADSNIIGIFIFDLEGRIIEAN